MEFSIKDMARYLTRGASKQEKQEMQKLMKQGAQHNRIYSIDCQDKASGFIPTYFTKPLIYAKQKYFCPNGWRRYSIDVGMSRQQFSDQYNEWPVCYHGTSFSSAKQIILNGFRAQNNAACFIKPEEKAVFLTPSIIYAGHPRYAKIQKYEDMYIQIVLQMRVNNKLIFRRPGTVQNTFKSCEKPVDPNYASNDQLQWVFIWNNWRNIKAKDGLIIYGLMARIVPKNPRYYHQNQWWEESRERLKWDRYQKS